LRTSSGLKLPKYQTITQAAPLAMSAMESDKANVKYLSNFETEILFPPGPAGFALEPVVRAGSRAVGARIVGFLPSSDRDVNLYRNSSPYPYPNSQSNFGDLASKHLTIGSVMQSIDDECVRNKSFDCIMVRNYYFVVYFSHTNRLISSTFVLHTHITMK
jgi:hypothetical protein